MAISNETAAGLPTRAFLYTLDQIATMINVSNSQLKRQYIFFYGRSVGDRPLDKMMARNIAHEGSPDWRVTEKELVRWLRRKGFRVHHKGWVIN